MDTAGIKWYIEECRFRIQMRQFTLALGKIYAIRRMIDELNSNVSN